MIFVGAFAPQAVLGAGAGIAVKEAIRFGVARGLFSNEAGALDPLVKNDLQFELLRIQEQTGKTIIFITHDINEAFKLGSRVGILRDGRMIQLDTPEKMLSAPANDYVRRFIDSVDTTKVLTVKHIMTVPGSVADEPTTALDVTVQAQILSLLKDLQAEMGSSSILITHDLGVIAQSCDSVVVMYAGRVVEKAPVRELFANPRHAYTKGLLASIPQLSSMRKTKLPTIPGQVASIADFVPGCRFCQRQGVPAEELTERPPLVEISPDHFVEACPRCANL